MILKDLLAHLPNARHDGPLHRTVTGLSSQSWRVMPQNVFFAVPHREPNPAGLVARALARHPAAIVSEQQVFTTDQTTLITVPNLADAMARAADVFYGQPSRKLRILAVAGGGDSPAPLVFAVQRLLECAGVPCGRISRLGHQLGTRVLPASRTPLDIVELQELLHLMVRAGCQACVLDLGHVAPIERWPWGLHFDVLLTATAETAGDPAPSAVPQALPRDWAEHIRTVLHARITHQLRTAPHWHIALESNGCSVASMQARRIATTAQGTRLAVEHGDIAFSLRTSWLGRDAIGQALAAAALGQMLGFSPSILQRTLSAPHPVPGHLERIRAGQPYLIAVDHAHHVGSLARALETLRPLVTGRLLLLFGCPGGTSQAHRQAMGRVAAQLADITVLTADDPCHESPGRICQQIVHGYREVCHEGPRINTDREIAIRMILEEARPGDAVLLAGKGGCPRQRVGDTIAPFDDALVATEILEDLGYTLPIRRSPPQTPVYGAAIA